MFNSVDLFAGCGGLTSGMALAGFDTRVAVEINEVAIRTFRLNHPTTHVIAEDIKEIKLSRVSKILNGETLHLLAGCPPCQGFSSIRRLNKKRNKRDSRNSLILEYLRFVRGLKPLTIMLENVPGLQDYYLFPKLIRDLRKLGYCIDYKIVNIKEYGVAQSRRRLVLVGSLLGKLTVAEPSGERITTVRDVIGRMESPHNSRDWVHKVLPRHSNEISERIKKTPKDGGSWRDLPDDYMLDCHRKLDSGFNDIYGRLRWDKVSATITGGCLNPSKGRFLHPEQDRCISAREAAMLQSFPKKYRFDIDTNKTELAMMIGNALPPKFSFFQSKNVYDHLLENLVKK